MIYKKGDKSKPENYRGIALVNVVAKLFTKILCGRLDDWAKQKGIYPECQGGFRADRSTYDNIFAALASVQLQLRHGQRKVFSLFVDLRRAFDSVSHRLLWQKLFRLGVSSKIIRVMKDLYEHATMKVRSGGDLTDGIDITEGVLQGESLSPTLFLLFLSDIESYLRDRGHVGPSINSTQDILTLLYADDLVLFASSQIQMYHMMHDLEEYFSLNQLTINVDKTKLVIFRSGGRVVLLPNYPLRFYGENVEAVPAYTYLGTVFSSSALGRRAAADMVDKARIATGAVMSILAKASADSWDAVTKLFDSMIASTLLYAAPTWALSYSDLIECIQSSYYKRLLLLPICTPGHVLRLEVGVVKLVYQVIKHTMSWYSRVLKQDVSRLPKACLLKFMTIASGCKQDITSELTRARNLRYNPVMQLEALLSSCGIVFDCTNPNAHYWIAEQPRVLSSLKSHLYNQNLARVMNSTFCQLSIPRVGTGLPATYLTQRLPLAMVRTKAQIRMANNRLLYFSTKRKFHRIDPSLCCRVCDRGVLETLTHLLLECPAYEKYRRPLLGDYLTPNCTSDEHQSALEELLLSHDPLSTKKLFLFMKCTLKTRLLLLAPPIIVPDQPLPPSPEVNLITKYFRPNTGP